MILAILHVSLNNGLFNSDKTSKFLYYYLLFFYKIYFCVKSPKFQQNCAGVRSLHPLCGKQATAANNETVFGRRSVACNAV